MATKLFLRTTTLNQSGVAGRKDMNTTAGAATTNIVVNTAAAGTQIQWTDSGGGTVQEWTTPPLAAGFTLATTDTMTFNIWAQENNMSANAGGRARVFQDVGDSVLNEVTGGPFNDGVEFGFSGANTLFNWTGVTAANFVFNAGDRIVVRYYITNVGTMGGGFTCTLGYNGGTGAADGDTWFQLNNTVTFAAEPYNAPDVLSRKLRSQKPAPMARVKKGHPIAPDFAWLLNDTAQRGCTYTDQGPAGYKALLDTNTSRPQPIKTPNGVLTNTPYTQPVIGSSARYIKGAQFSIAWAMRAYPASTSGFLVGGIFVGSNKDCTARTTSTDMTNANMEWAFGSGSLVTTGLNYTTDSIWVVTAGSRGQEIWKDGIKVASTGTVPTFTSDATLNLYLWGGGGLASPVAKYGFVYFYQRQLMPEEVLWVTEDPFAPFVTTGNKIRARAPSAPTVGYAFFPAFVTVERTSIISGGMTPPNRQPPENLTG